LLLLLVHVLNHLPSGEDGASAAADHHFTRRRSQVAVPPPSTSRALVVPAPTPTTMGRGPAWLVVENMALIQTWLIEANNPIRGTD